MYCSPTAMRANGTAISHAASAGDRPAAPSQDAECAPAEGDGQQQGGTDGYTRPRDKS
jgi:hypothetical protein